jgi:hypothetical protein
MGRSAPAHGVGTLTLAVSCRFGVSLSWPAVASHLSERRFARSAQGLGPGSRHFYAGRRLGSKQVPPRLVSGSFKPPVSTSGMPLDTCTVVHSRSPSWSSPDAVSAVPFPRCSPPRLLTGAARGGLEPPPAGRLRGANPHPLGSTVSSGLIYSMKSPCVFRRIRTYVSDESARSFQSKAHGLVRRSDVGTIQMWLWV